MPKLFSYVVDHDLGFAPNPFGGLCSLAKCKFGGKRRNIVELAKVGDWIAGTGATDVRKSAGRGKLIYAMGVDEILPLEQYSHLFSNNRVDAEQEEGIDGRLALISKRFFYFGRNAIDITEIPSTYLDHPFEKLGPGHRSDFSEEFVCDFARWLSESFKVGVHGPPCKPLHDVPMKCPVAVRRKSPVSPQTATRILRRASSPRRTRLHSA